MQDVHVNVQDVQDICVDVRDVRVDVQDVQDVHVDVRDVGNLVQGVDDKLDQANRSPFVISRP